jgi:hypothetical protein
MKTPSKVPFGSSLHLLVPEGKLVNLGGKAKGMTQGATDGANRDFSRENPAFEPDSGADLHQILSPQIL